MPDAWHEEALCIRDAPPGGMRGAFPPYVFDFYGEYAEKLAKCGGEMQVFKNTLYQYISYAGRVDFAIRAAPDRSCVVRVAGRHVRDHTIAPRFGPAAYTSIASTVRLQTISAPDGRSNRVDSTRPTA